MQHWHSLVSVWLCFGIGRSGANHPRPPVVRERWELGLPRGFTLGPMDPNIDSSRILPAPNLGEVLKADG